MRTHHALHFALLLLLLPSALSALSAQDVGPDLIGPTPSITNGTSGAINGELKNGTSWAVTVNPYTPRVPVEVLQLEGIFGRFGANYGPNSAVRCYRIMIWDSFEAFEASPQAGNVYNRVATSIDTGSGVIAWGQDGQGSPTFRIGFHIGRRNQEPPVLLQPDRTYYYGFVAILNSTTAPAPYVVESRRGPIANQAWQHAWFLQTPRSFLTSPFILFNGNAAYRMVAIASNMPIGDTWIARGLRWIFRPPLVYSPHHLP